jgi:DNA-binding response OmpR family regulator
MRVLLVEDEPYMAEAIRDGLRLEAIAADIAGDGESALKLLRLNDCWTGPSCIASARLSLARWA